MSRRRKTALQSSRPRPRRARGSKTVPASERHPAAVQNLPPEVGALPEAFPSVPDVPPATATSADAKDSAAAPVRETQLIVEISEALYAMPISGIEEILPMKEVAPLPRSAATVRGVLFLRGHAVTVVDMGILLGGDPARGGRIVVLAIEGERYGLVVDQVLKVVPATELDNLSAPPAALGSSHAVCGVARLAEQVISLIDLERLIPASAVSRAEP